MCTYWCEVGKQLNETNLASRERRSIDRSIGRQYWSKQFDFTEGRRDGGIPGRRATGGVVGRPNPRRCSHRALQKTVKPQFLARSWQFRSWWIVSFFGFGVVELWIFSPSRNQSGEYFCVAVIWWCPSGLGFGGAMYLDEIRAVLLFLSWDSQKLCFFVWLDFSHRKIL